VRVSTVLTGTAIAVALAGASMGPPSARAAELPAATRDQLASATYVYISTQRKDGTFGKAAEIWFMWHDGAVWVGSPPTTWRVKRIKHKRANAKIAVGKPDGPSFEAVGSIVKDPKIADLLRETYAKKYPDRWPGYADRFKAGFADGSRVLVRYVPK
jgi:hypothetical protein